jgi:drug/metabolite transporter (DMT)-like permease
MLRYISVFYSFMADLVVFDESFSQLQIVGALIVVITNVITILHKVRQDSHKAQLAYVG